MERKILEPLRHPQACDQSQRQISKIRVVEIHTKGTKYDRMAMGMAIFAV